jgi:hypothetical protein
MTEAEWLACTDPAPMFGLLHGKASDRKLRLFAVACCRRIWNLIPNGACRQAVEISERYADGAMRSTELEAARATIGARPSRRLYGGRMSGRTAAVRATIASAEDAAHAAARAARAAVQRTKEMEKRGQSDLLRCVFGNPFRLLFPIPQAILAWNDGTVQKIAQAIYDQRAFDCLPILADALEEAGCDNKDILAHCRGPGPHARGCWLIDLLLGKE